MRCGGGADETLSGNAYGSDSSAGRGEADAAEEDEGDAAEGAEQEDDDETEDMNRRGR